MSLNEEKDYLQGEVEFFDDDDLAPVPAELRDQALSNYRALSGLGPRADTATRTWRIGS